MVCVGWTQKYQKSIFCKSATHKYQKDIILIQAPKNIGLQSKFLPIIIGWTPPYIKSLSDPPGQVPLLSCSPPCPTNPLASLETLGVPRNLIRWGPYVGTSFWSGVLSYWIRWHKLLYATVATPFSKFQTPVLYLDWFSLNAVVL